jgi:hypothetical protein
MPLSPPPSEFYNTHEEAYNSTLEWAEEHGYGFSLRRSKPDGDRPKTCFVYQCIRRSLRSSKATIRQTSTLSSNCKFSFTIKQVSTVPPRWGVLNTYPHHNHDPAEHPGGLSCHRKRSNDVKDTIKSMTASHVAPKQIFSVLKQQDPNINIQMVDIYNEQRDLKVARLQGRTPIESLLQRLGDDTEWVSAYRTDGEERLNALFFAHTAQVKLIRAYPDVLLMDCTYRTNKYKMPLFHILGVGPMNKQFSAGFAFMKTESEIDYHWVLSNFINLAYEGLKPTAIITDNEQALRTACDRLFPGTPRLLCGWHVRQNVLTQAKRTWRVNDGETPEEQEEINERRDAFMSRWEVVQTSKSEADFAQNWAELLLDYSSHISLINYLETYQFPQRQLVVRAWTSTVRHFNNTTTSRLEGAHSHLKSYIENSRCDLDKLVDAISLMLRKTNNELSQITARARDRVPFSVLGRKYRCLPTGINVKISPMALELILIQYQKARTQTSEALCTGKFTAIYGLPCQHHLRDKLQRNPDAQVEYHEIDRHWFFERPNRHNLILPSIPLVRATVLPPSETPLQRTYRRDSSTRRDPSQFEREPPSRSGAPDYGQQRGRGRSSRRARGRGLRRGLSSTRVPGEGQPQVHPQGQPQGQPQEQSRTHQQSRTHPRTTGQGQSGRTFEGLYDARLQQIEDALRQSREDNASFTRAITSLLTARLISNSAIGVATGASNTQVTSNPTFSGGSHSISATTVNITSSPERERGGQKRKRTIESDDEPDDGPSTQRPRI